MTRTHLTRARAWAVRILYEWEAGDPALLPVQHLTETLASRIVAPDRIPHLRRIIETFQAERASVDSVLADALEHWTFDRLARIDRQILRIGAIELLYFSDVPRAVAIHEAVRLAERYGSHESPRFVNGILDAIAEASTAAE